MGTEFDPAFPVVFYHKWFKDSNMDMDMNMNMNMNMDVG